MDTVGADTAEARKALADAAALLAAAGIEADTRILPGQPETELGNLVEAEGFGLVVMGVYGHGRIRSLVIGWTTTEMIRSCKVPILLMRRTAGAAGRTAYPARAFNSSAMPV